MHVSWETFLLLPVAGIEPTTSRLGASLQTQVQHPWPLGRQVSSVKMSTGILLNCRTMNLCMRRCCASASCDLAYMVDKNCFSVKCYSAALCKISGVPTTNGHVQISTILQSSSPVAQKRTLLRLALVVQYVPHPPPSLLLSLSVFQCSGSIWHHYLKLGYFVNSLGTREGRTRRIRMEVEFSQGFRCCCCFLCVLQTRWWFMSSSELWRLWREPEESCGQFVCFLKGEYKVPWVNYSLQFMLFLGQHLHATSTRHATRFLKREHNPVARL